MFQLKSGFVLTGLLFRAKSRRLDESVNEGAHFKVVVPGLAHDFSGQILICKAERATESVGHQRFRKSASEVVSALGHRIAQLGVASKLAAVRKLAAGINRKLAKLDAASKLPALVDDLVVPPKTDGCEVFQTVADRIDLLVAVGTLRLLLMSPREIAGGKNLPVELSIGTFGGAGGGGSFRSFRSTQAPRSTGEVRCPSEPIARTAAVLSSPPRFDFSSTGTRRKLWPSTPGMP